MSGPPIHSHTYNSFQIINGGRGGDGGVAGAQGHGGGGGIGEAPALNYDINSQNFTMNFLLQDRWPHDTSSGVLPASTPELETAIEGASRQFTGVARNFRRGMRMAFEGIGRQFTGVMRNFRRGMGAKQTPYDVSSHPRALLTGLHSETLSSRSSDVVPSSSTAFPPGMPRSDAFLPHQKHFKGQNPANFWAGPYPNYHSHMDSSQSIHPHVPAHGPHSKDDYTRFGCLPPSFQANPPLSGGGPSITITHHKETGLDILYRSVAWEALYDSAAHFDQPKCHPETRTELLNNLYNWAIDPTLRTPIQWLHGPAGAGKSAIMQTLCRQLQEARRLGGSFFFKRGHSTCGNAKLLFTTLAYQLVFHRQELKGPLSQSIERDPSILHRCMDVQLCNLILEPWKSADDTSPSVLLIDGLDECDGHKIQREILRLIGSTSDKHQPTLRVLVASRQEPHIWETFQEESLQRVAESTNIKQSFEDVRTYLRGEFSRIHHEHSTMKKIPTPWPVPETLEKLVQKSSGYFIYAATVIKFVDDEYAWPSKQLDIVVQNLIPADSESPFATLDQLYMQILSRVPGQYHLTLYDILCVIIWSPKLTLQDIDVLLGLKLGTVELIIRPLHSVLKVPASSLDQLGVHHASFLDFLKDETRSSSFYVGSAEHRAKLGHFILKALAYTYDNPQNNLSDPKLYWALINMSPNWIEYITSLPSSADLVPHIQLVNLDFVVNWAIKKMNVEDFVTWLKEIHPIPEVLIQRWENYRFVLQYEGFQEQIVHNLLYDEWHPGINNTDALVPSLSTINALHSRMTGEVQAIVMACWELLSQSPDLVRIFHATRLLTPYPSYWTNPGYYFNRLFRTHIVLDLSWDKILGCICSVCPLIPHETVFFFHTLFLFLPALCSELDHLYPVAMVSRDLACGFLRLMQQIGTGERPISLWNVLYHHGDPKIDHRWGHHIRSSQQPDPELLQKLQQFVPPWEIFSEYMVATLEPIEFYDVVQWLKASPSPQADLIGCWQGYLVKSITQKSKYDINPVDYSDDMLEKRWQEHLKREADFHGPPQEEVIKCWESCLRKAREEDESDGNTTDTEDGSNDYEDESDGNTSDTEDGSDDYEDEDDGSEE